MKLQHLAIIFVIIIIPISVVLSAYIQNQIDLIEIQTAYDNILINSTYDAVKAFQLNTTNNKYSTISDSKIRDIEAAVSTFYNSLNTSMTKYGMSPTDLEVYTPALLFTLYDGYYIYSSYNNVYSLEKEGDKEKASINLDESNFENGLKPYVYYSAKYKLNSGNVIVVNYTLDNEITVYGDFGDGYETKSGYLIDTGKVKNIDETNKTLIYDNDIIIQKEQLQEHLITIEDSATGETKEGDYNYIFYQNKKIYQDIDNYGRLLYYDNNGDVTIDNSITGIPVIFWYDNYTKTYIQDAQTKKYAQECQMYSTSAYDYYKEAYEFSMWVQDKLKDVTQKNMLKIENPNEFITQKNNPEEEFYLSENTGDDENIFEFSDTNDPMLSDSTFNNHRLAVIRKSIETNLNAVISSYQNTALYEYEMPIMSSQDWYKILNNVSVVSYMQGMPMAGYRYYNNYAVITNNVNKEVVTNENIYIIAEKTGGTDNNREYHLPGCKELIDGVNNGSLSIIGAYSTASFQRQTVKISENNEKHFYFQSRVGDTLTSCYNCVVSATGNYSADDIIKGEIRHYEDKNVLYDKDDLKEIRTAYLKALAREKYNLYKTNFDLGN